jgi:trimethylamine-N-oxide reductase (cytochrome c)
MIGHSLGGFSGGGEPNEVYVKHNKIVRIKPLDYLKSYTEEEIAPAIWNFEAPDRKTGTMKPFGSLKKAVPGRFAVTYKKRIYSPNRVRYPLKRSDWNPGGGANVNAQNRGRSKFVRISWDEATEMVASEITRVVNTYGSNSILLMGDGHAESKVIQGPHGCHTRLIKNIGPATRQIRNPDSWEGWYWGAKHVWGGSGFGNQAITTNLMYDISVNSDLLICQGCDWETTPHGFAGQFQSRLARYWKDINIPMIFISPDLNYMAAVYANKWIPVLPNTDSAFMLGIIYTWLDEDLYDKDYVDTHTVGAEEFFEYVRGNGDDGVAKTPAWASERCGVPEWTIKAHARKLAKCKTSYLHYWGGSIVRGPYSHEPGRLEPILMGMQGWGGPGVNQVAMSLNMPPTVIRMGFMGNSTGDPSGTMQDQNLPRTLVHKALLGDYSPENPMTWYASASFSATIADQFKKYYYPIPAEEGGVACHLLWCDNPCRTGCWNGGFETIDAHRMDDRLECIIMQHPWMENDMLFSDIILPSNTMFEEEDILAASWAANQNVWAALVKQCIKPVGESMGDWDVVVEIAKELGLEEATTGGEDVATKIRNTYEGTALKDLITWEDLNEKKYVLAPVTEGWQNSPAGHIAFYTDPVKNPLGTPSGLLEFTSDRIRELLPDDRERPPHPEWVIGGSKEDGWMHDETLWGERCKRYPYLMISNHPRWRMHVQCDDVTWLREIPLNKHIVDGYAYEVMWMHPEDAAKEGLKHGDLVKIYNDRGTTLGAVYETERIKKGAVYQDHGSRVDLICDGVDRGGSNNLISPDGITSTNCPGMATSGYLVAVEKLSGEQMQEWRDQYPEAFSRAYDPYCGLKFEAWVDTVGGDK